MEKVKGLIFQVSFLDTRNKDGVSAAEAAAGGGHVEVLQTLLGAGASANGPVGKTGPLHAAARSGSRACFEMLVAAGADESVTDADGKTAGEVLAESTAATSQPAGGAGVEAAPGQA